MAMSWVAEATHRPPISAQKLQGAGEMENWFISVPAAGVEVIPYPEYLEATGVSTRYEPPGPDRPGTYRINLFQPEEQEKWLTGRIRPIQ